MATRRQARRLSLLGNMSEVQRRLRFIESQPYSFRLANRVVKRRSIQFRAVANDELDTSSVNNRVLADGSVTSGKVGAGEIKTVNIDLGAVLSGNIGNLEIRNANIAANAITTDKIQDGEVRTNDIGDLQVTTAKLAQGAVTSPKIGGLEVKRANIDNAAVDTAQLAPNAVDRTIIRNREVINDKLADNAVENRALAEDSVGTGKIRDFNVTARKLGDGAVINRVIFDGAVTSSKLGQGAVTTDKIDTQAVENRKIREGTITKNRLAFTPVTRVSAGSGLSGGGAADEVTLSANFGTGENNVARGNHGHNNFASANHRHNYSGRTGEGGTSAANLHTHLFGGQTDQPSSIRFKKDISSYDFDATKLLNVDLKKFRYLNQYKKHSVNRDWFFGYLAEEILDLGLEELVCYDENGKPNALNYSLVGVMALELIKLQEKRINKLETAVEKMKKGSA